MKLLRYGLLLVCLCVIGVGISMTQEDDPQVLRIAAIWTGAEAEGFQTVLDLFTEKTGIEVTYEPDPVLVDTVVKSSYLENPADIVLLPRPGVIRQLVSDKRLVPLDDPDDPILSVDQLVETLNPEFIRLGVVENRQYAVMLTSRSKSTIWYKPASFEELGLEVPQTWDELQAITDTFVEDGRIPFALGGGDGWTLTDWFENIFIRMNGREAYSELFVLDQMAWDDPRVKATLKAMSDLLLPVDERLAKGADSVLNVGFRESVESWLSGDAEMYYEGGFVRATAQELFADLVCSEDYSFFMFPEIDPEYGTPIIGGGQLAVAFQDTDAVRQFMEFIISEEGATAWVQAEVGSIISPNRLVPLEAYVDPCSKFEAEQVRSATTFAFDGSDLLTGILGEYALFTGLQDYLMDPDGVNEILEYLVFAVIKS